MEDTSNVKRAGSAADTEEDFSTVTTTTAASESGFEDLATSETDSNVRVAPSDTGSSSATATAAHTGAAAPTPVVGGLGNSVNGAVPAPARARQANEPTQQVSVADSSSLTTHSSGLVLFDITNKPGGTACCSPHTIRTVLDLKLLGVGYERQRLTYTQVRNELAERIADNVTVPALELSDGSHIVDSWNIAEYLERRHPEGYRLFGSSATKRLAAMLNQFGKTLLAPHIAPMAHKGVHAMLDPDSASYFTDVKVGRQRWAKFCSLTQADKEALVQQAVAKLEVVNAMLTCEGIASHSEQLAVGDAHRSRSASRSKKSLWLAGGDDPTHADFVLFGWYVFTRAAGEKVTREIWYTHRPIGKWVDAMLEWCGELAQDFV